MKKCNETLEALHATRIDGYINILKHIFKEGADGRFKMVPIPEGKDVNPFRCIEIDNYAERLIRTGLGVIWSVTLPLEIKEDAKAALSAAGINVVFYDLGVMSAVRFVKQNLTHGYISIQLPPFKFIKVA